MLKRFSRVLAASALLAGSLAGMAHADQPVINFGIISTESSQNLKSIWEPFLKDMSQQTGYQVKAFFAPDYAGIIQGMRFDKVDIAWYGNKAAMEAVDRAHGEIFAQTVAASGAPGYWSLLIANKDSKIDSVEDMLANAKSLTFGNGDPNSTSGYLVPGYYVFAKNNVDPVKAFKRTLNSSHEVNALAVANKQVDVATFNTEGMERLELTQPEKARQLKVIWKSPLIPGDPLVWRNNLSDEQKNKLRDFFFKYGANAEQKKVLADLQWSKFQPSDDDQLLPIRQLELFKQRTDVANNANLGAEEKAAKLKALDEELAKLEKRMAEREQKTAANAGGAPADAPPCAVAHRPHPVPRPYRPTGGTGPVDQPRRSLPVPGRPLGEAHDRLAFRSHHRRTTALDGRARPRPSRGAGRPCGRPARCRLSPAARRRDRHDPGARTHGRHRQPVQPRRDDRDPLRGAAR